MTIIDSNLVQQIQTSVTATQGLLQALVELQAKAGIVTAEGSRALTITVTPHERPAPSKGGHD